MERSLSIYFDKFSMAEWIEQYIKPITNLIEDLNNKRDVLNSINC